VPNTSEDIDILKNKLSNAQRDNSYLKRQASQNETKNNEIAGQLKEAQLKKAARNIAKGMKGAGTKRSNDTSAAARASKKHKNDSAKVEWVRICSDSQILPCFAFLQFPLISDCFLPVFA
jgi:uncharacterized protein YPO0396